MIQFERDGTSLKVRIEANSSITKRWFIFNWACNDEIYAELLVKNFKEHLESKMKEARREAYKQGWADAKAKRAKETWFGGWI